MHLLDCINSSKKQYFWIFINISSQPTFSKSLSIYRALQKKQMWNKNAYIVSESTRYLLDESSLQKRAFLKIIKRHPNGQDAIILCNVWLFKIHFDFPLGKKKLVGKLEEMLDLTVYICSSTLAKSKLERIFSPLIVSVLFFLKRIFCP